MTSEKKAQNSLSEEGICRGSQKRRMDSLWKFKYVASDDKRPPKLAKSKARTDSQDPPLDSMSALALRSEERCCMPTTLVCVFMTQTDHANAAGSAESLRAVPR